jgi:hypothetical protein
MIQTSYSKTCSSEGTQKQAISVGLQLANRSGDPIPLDCYENLDWGGLGDRYPVPPPTLAVEANAPDSKVCPAKPAGYEGDTLR